MEELSSLISVVLCTYNRTQMLRAALNSLMSQSLEKSEYEIVVVDNAASLEVAELVAKYQLAFKVHFHYVPENTLGLHHARHAGARSAKGDLLVFTDDDATFEAGWLQAYVKAFAGYPHMAAAGGPVRPTWQAAPPRWLQQFLKDKKMFPILSLNESGSRFSLGPRGFFFGVNMAIRRSILFEVGGFNPEAFGEVWLGNGETGLNHKLWERGMLVGYVPDAIVYHQIPAERMTVEYFRRRMANEGACDMYTRFHQKMPGPIGLVGQAASIVLRNCVLWLIASLVNGRTGWFSLRVQLQAARSRSQLNYVSRLMRNKDFRKFVLKQDWLNSSCTLE